MLCFALQASKKARKQESKKARKQESKKARKQESKKALSKKKIKRKIIYFIITINK